MPPPTAEAPPHPARTAILAVARDTVVAGRWADTTMAGIAAAAGVSRQTVYNEFGSRDALAAAVAAVTAERFRTGALQVAAAESTPLDRIAAATAWSLRTARADQLVMAVLTDDAGDLLPFLTTRSADLLLPITRTIAESIDHPRAAWACEVAMRLTVSHLLLPVRSDADHIALVTELIEPLLSPNPGARHVHA